MSPRGFLRRSVRWRRFWRSVKNAFAYGSALVAIATLRPIPLSLALPLSAAVGAALFYLLPSVRRLSEEHLRLAFGDSLSPGDRRRIARRSLANIGRCFCEVAKFDTIARRLEDYVEVEGMEIAAAILRQGRGAIAVTGHLGNWELLAAYFAHKGIPVTAVARRIYDDRINDLIVSFRRRQGVETILRHDPQAARKILHTLNRNGLLAMVIDQDTQAPSLSVPFFGRAARTPVAPATLARFRSSRCSSPGGPAADTRSPSIHPCRFRARAIEWRMREPWWLR